MSCFEGESRLDVAFRCSAFVVVSVRCHSDIVPARKGSSVVESGA